jgi:hypothetical protein
MFLFIIQDLKHRISIVFTTSKQNSTATSVFAATLLDANVTDTSAWSAHFSSNLQLISGIDPNFTANPKGIVLGITDDDKSVNFIVVGQIGGNCWVFGFCVSCFVFRAFVC